MRKHAIFGIGTRIEITITKKVPRHKNFTTMEHIEELEEYHGTLSEKKIHIYVLFTPKEYTLPTIKSTYWNINGQF